MADKLRWLLAELRARSIDCFKEGEGITVVVLPESGGVFDAFWYQRRWYLGSCAIRGATYVVPDGVNVAEVCADWVASWLQTPPATPGAGAEAPPAVVARHGLHRMSRAEVKEWMATLWNRAWRRALRIGGGK